MSIWDEDRFGVAVVVFCDRCGDEHDADYIVPAGVDSLATARHHLMSNEGWGITPGRDPCPNCQPSEAAPGPGPGDTDTNPESDPS